jgi:tRNA wybutosine-synthesizing protein 1
MISNKKIIDIMIKQGYRFLGNHAAVKICEWTKKSLRDEGVCYKEKFYGIKSHLCCQMTPWLGCYNNCLHCWRALELNFNRIINKNQIKNPKEIIDECIKAQKKLLIGFKINSKSKKKQLSRVNMKKWQEAQEPMQFAISLSGEPTLYEKIGDLIKELRQRGKTSFLVTNGLYPEKILELKDKNQLPTQLYVSVNSSNKKDYKKFHRSSEKNAWEKLNKTLEILQLLNCRTIFRINLIQNLNMAEKNINEFARLIKKSRPMFVELKGFMSVGFARERLGYDRMPWHKDVLNFAKKLTTTTGLRILDEHERSCAVVLGKDKKELKIKKI